LADPRFNQLGEAKLFGFKSKKGVVVVYLTSCAKPEYRFDQNFGGHDSQHISYTPRGHPEKHEL
jgi:hypothetical protein